ncbi:MAG: glycosyl hydrolase 115 family protein [Prevotella sp.]|nr:glycosyl hydrolase 115 family protein [Prevotella sp.]
MKKCLLLFLLVCSWLSIAAQKSFCIASKEEVASIVVDNDDWKGVIRAAHDLGDDIGRVTGRKAQVVSDFRPDQHQIVAGTIGKSKLIDRLIKQKKLDVKIIKGKWEAYKICVVDDNLVIAGSDKRGTIYGIYEISQRIGVSPWYWMADAPVIHKDEIWYNNDYGYDYAWPAVKYRGIFINDEWPSFGTWCEKHFGGVNSKAYEKIFELLLRLKANYFWPAMWATAFNEDDPESPRLADEMGIVMGTSHHEPMMRSHREYLKRKDEVGPWDYATNKERVDQFFREGMERNKAYDNLVTIGMRGDGDVAMGKGDDQENMKTLQNVIKGQRKIIKDIYGREDAVPQLWAIFTEVQRYYDAGFTVPDDVTLLFCDNNWGYIRRKGTEAERKRKGGLGLYYHIDMNGGPWNDRWVNTTTVPKLREQLNQAYQSGINRIWIINVGDLKPKEMPISFIMDYAWRGPSAFGPLPPDPKKVTHTIFDDEFEWLRQWTASVLGGNYAQVAYQGTGAKIPDGILNQEITHECAEIIAQYSKLNLMRKPEVQVPGLFNYEEMLQLNDQWQRIVLRCERLKEQIPAEAQDAFYQLVYYPAVASAGVAMMYNAATMGDRETVFELMEKDKRLTDYYNKVMAGGKWDGMMLDNHIGYTKWSIPDKNTNPMDLGYKVNHDLSASKDTREYTIAADDYQDMGEGWMELPGLGHGDYCIGAVDVMKSYPNGDGPVLEYNIDLSPVDGKGTVAIGILPTQDVYPARGLRLGVQIDDWPMATVDARQGLHDEFQEYTPKNLAQSKNLKPLPPRNNLLLSGWRNGRKMLRRDEVFDNIRWLEVNFGNITPGKHKLKLILIDPEIVVDQIVVNPDNNRYSYFGTPGR